MSLMKKDIAIKDFASPVTRMPFVNSPSIYMADIGVLGAVCYSDVGEDSHLFLIDVEKMKEERFPLPRGEKGAYGFARGADGNLYLGKALGKILRFDMRRKRLTVAAHPFKDGQWIWGGGASSRGRIYMGVYPTGEFAEYDIASGRCRNIRPKLKRGVAHYACRFLELPDGNMLVGVGGGEFSLFVHNPRTRALMKIFSGDAGGRLDAFPFLHAFYDEHSIIVDSKKGLLLFEWKKRIFRTLVRRTPEKVLAIQRAGKEFFGIGYPTGTLYRIGRRTCEAVKTEFPNGNRLLAAHQISGDEFCGLGDNGLFMRFSTATGRKRCLQVRNSTRTGMAIQFLKASPNGKRVVGAHFINMQMYVINARSGSSRSSLNKIAPYSGQVCCGTFIKEAFYLGSYTRAVLHALDVKGAFRYGCNPRTIGEIGHEQNRPVAMTNDNALVYIATKADYGILGGALSVLNPETDAVRVYRDFVPGQNPTSCYFYAPTRCLVGTTESFADMRTRAPEAKAAVVYVWDTKRKRTLHTSSPWKSDGLYGYGFSDDGKLIGFTDKRYFVFDVRTHDYTVRDWTHGAVTKGIFLNNVDFYGATRTHLFRLNVETGRVALVARTENTFVLEKLSDRVILFNYRGSRIRKLVVARREGAPSGAAGRQRRKR
jgi:hypothetical protein